LANSGGTDDSMTGDSKPTAASTVRTHLAV
jgi:hypothetical protein